MNTAHTSVLLLTAIDQQVPVASFGSAVFANLPNMEAYTVVNNDEQ